MFVGPKFVGKSETLIIANYSDAKQTMLTLTDLTKY